MEGEKEARLKGVEKGHRKFGEAGGEGECRKDLRIIIRGVWVSGKMRHCSGKDRWLQREKVVQREGDKLPQQNRLCFFNYSWNNVSHSWWFGEKMEHSIQVWNGCVNQEQMEFTVQGGNILRASPEILLQTSFDEKSGENFLLGSCYLKIYSAFHLVSFEISFALNNIKLNQVLEFAISSSFYSECNCKRSTMPSKLTPFKYFFNRSNMQ